MFCFILGVYLLMCRLDTSTKKPDPVPDWLKPPCQTHGFHSYTLNKQWHVGSYVDNQTTCDEYLEYLEMVEKRKEREKYLDKLEDTIKELKEKVASYEMKRNPRGPGCTCYIRDMDQICVCKV
jgi:phosphopantetheine adenylyltransferase